MTHLKHDCENFEATGQVFAPLALGEKTTQEQYDEVLAARKNYTPNVMAWNPSELSETQMHHNLKKGMLEGEARADGAGERRVVH